MILIERVLRERLLFGHRGVPQEAPENTVAGFRRALELELDGVELDVRMCRTGELIVFHDDRVDRLTNGSGLIEELSFSEIKSLDASKVFGSRFRGETIPELHEVLELLGGKMLVNIELKTKSYRDDGLEAEVAALIRKMRLQSSVILSSFNPFSIARIKRNDQSLPIALLFADDQPVHLRRAWAANFLKLDGIHPRYSLLDERLVRKARKRNWFIGCWTIDVAGDAARLYQAGANILITNRPAQLREELNREWEVNR